MIPVSLYKKEADLTKYHIRLNALIASTSEMDRNNHEIFMLSQFPNSRIDSGSYDGLMNRLSSSQYDVLILDNDAFLVGKNPALDNLAIATEFLDNYRIIVTSSVPNQDLINKTRNMGARFVEKGKWKTLAEIVKSIAERKYHSSTRPETCHL